MLERTKEVLLPRSLRLTDEQLEQRIQVATNHYGALEEEFNDVHGRYLRLPFNSAAAEKLGDKMRKISHKRIKAKERVNALQWVKDRREKKKGVSAQSQRA